MSARNISIGLGVWLLLSAFLWPHTPSQLTNTWLCGALSTGFAVMALSVPNARYLNTALSLWLFVSAFALPADNVGTVWNNALVAVGIFIASLVETPSDVPFEGRRRPMLPV